MHGRVRLGPGLIITIISLLALFLLALIPVNATDTLTTRSSLPISFVIRKDLHDLVIYGNGSSTAHAVILRRTAQRHMKELDISIDLDQKARTPPGWALVTELVLRALAQTEIAHASITPSAVKIEGVTARPGDFAAALKRVEAALPDEMAIVSNISVISIAASFEQLCQERFSLAAASGKIEFAVSTSDIEEKARPLLDALIQIATDCPAMMIRVTGRTDTSGNAITNATLGLARATRLIEYMTAHGVPVGQFEAARTVSMPANTARRDQRRANIEMIRR